MAAAQDVAAADVAEVLVAEHPLLARYTADALCHRLATVGRAGPPDVCRPRAHLPDTRLCAAPRGPAAPAARHRRGRHSWYRCGSDASCVRCFRASSWLKCAHGARPRPSSASRSAHFAAMRRDVAPVRHVHRWQSTLDDISNQTAPRGAVPGSTSGGGPESGRAHRVRGARYQVAGSAAGRGAAGNGPGRGNRCVASDLRQRLAADGPADRQLGPDCGAEALRRAGNLRRDPASRRHEGIAHDRRHQQGSPRRRSSRWPTTASSATCSRSSPRWSPSSRVNQFTRHTGHNSQLVHAEPREPGCRHPDRRCGSVRSIGGAAAVTASAEDWQRTAVSRRPGEGSRGGRTFAVRRGARPVGAPRPPS